MRFRLDVAADRPELAWRDVHGPARGVVYGLLKSQDPELSQQLHDVGWQGHALRPLAISPPIFSGAKKRKGAYATSSKGSVWIGSPVPRIAGCLLAALAGRQHLRWGEATLQIKGVEVENTPDHSSGEAVFETVSPVILKHEGRYLLPGDAAYEERLVHNLRHKADVLGLPSDVRVEVLAAGPRRRFDVQGAMRIGATVKLSITAAPRLLDAIYDWGLGLVSIQGFGWIR
ncbi:CRISPR-associated protein Cas6 [Thermomonospora curvata DSM 43183]|uniref:CRISPR-associated protein Cas6 n=1 Tax=Thermomonospora curvata (strain ATCC 19995 / DSM 43183 / JCM 3096 / KCTC 9072 / NBRC 15933 / NCIMB 10081 / Henssen B9) TaxID=471852 RepID=D1A6P3_THECD|nr:CRISPR-associated protein Cas6 [Thermomonospora curvata DSM 43183]PKK15531.1 MAG: CRISPR-associated endoribonuclease Cas6 [Thermomonospora sp. CIF 1]